MTSPGTFPKYNPVGFAPSGWRLRDIMSAHASKADMREIAATVNHLLCHMRPRFGACVFAGDLKWTDNDAAAGYVAANEVDWRQPFSQGLSTVRYRLRVNATAGRTGYIRILGADGVTWKETNFAGGAWTTIDVANVDLAGAGTAQYFTPKIQGKLDASGTIQVRSMGWTEDVLSSVPTTGIDGVTGVDILHDVTADLPLSADVVEEVTRALLWCLDKRTRSLVNRISTDGTGAHPNNAWTSAAAAYEEEFWEINDTSVVGRTIAMIDHRLDRSVQLHVKAKSDGVKTGYFRARTRHNRNLPALELNWTNIQNTLSWKSTSGQLSKVGDESWSFPGTEFQFEVKDDLVVARVGIWADETSYAF